MHDPCIARAELPTFKEAGRGGYAGCWTGIAAPPGASPDIAAKLQSEVVKALGAPDMIEFAATMSVKTGPHSPEAFGKLVADDTAIWALIAAKAQIEKQ